MPPLLPSLTPSSSDSSSDSDFAASLSSSDSETHATGRKRRKTGGELSSGDEVVVKSAAVKRRKKAKKGENEGRNELDDDDGEGVGARVRRRRGGGEELQKISLPDPSVATVNVDELWAQMNSAPAPAPVTGSARPDTKTSEKQVPATETLRPPLPAVQDDDTATRPTKQPEKGIQTPQAEDVISVKRTYVFAGETITEEKLVSKSSAEARLHLQSQPVASTDTTTTTTPSSTTKKPPLRRPKKRASMFDPQPQVGVRTPPGKDKGPKLNTIEKSKMDWAGYVDQAGIKDELDGAEKAKEGYLGKMDFLGRVGAKREDERLSTKRR